MELYKLSSKSGCLQDFYFYNYSPLSPPHFPKVLVTDLSLPEKFELAKFSHLNWIIVCFDSFE